MMWIVLFVGLCALAPSWAEGETRQREFSVILKPQGLHVYRVVLS